MNRPLNVLMIDAIVGNADNDVLAIVGVALIVLVLFLAPILLDAVVADTARVVRVRMIAIV